MLYPWLFILPVLMLALIIGSCIVAHQAKKHKKTKQKKVLISHTNSIRNLDEYKKAQKNYLFLLFLGALFLFGSLFMATIAASRPITLSLVKTEYANRDISLCLDVSGSMDSMRDDMIGHLEEIVSTMKGERFSITIFDGSVATIMPFTDDYNSAIEMLRNIKDDLYVFSFGVHEYTYGSSLAGPGLAGCAQSFDRLGEAERSRSIIVYTDNLAPDSQPINILQAAKFAKRYGITVYGINPIDNSTDGQYQGPAAKQFTEAVALTGGSYYAAGAENTDISSIIDQIMEQQAALVEGADKYAKVDVPTVPIIIAAVLGCLYLVVVWRLRL